MKKIYIWLLMALCLHASEIQEFADKMGYETNYEFAIKKAKSANKEVMFVMVTNYCPWCRKFEKRTLVKEEVNALVHKNYVPLILNREKGEYPKQFYTQRIPVVMFINPKNETKVKESLGFKNVKDFIAVLEGSK